MSATYDAIGVGYALRRRPDPHIAAAIVAALRDARTAVNVGAGKESYENIALRERYGHLLGLAQMYVSYRLLQ